MNLLLLKWPPCPPHSYLPGVHLVKASERFPCTSGSPDVCTEVDVLADDVAQNISVFEGGLKPGRDFLPGLEAESPDEGVGTLVSPETKASLLGWLRAAFSLCPHMLSVRLHLWCLLLMAFFLKKGLLI